MVDGTAGGDNPRCLRLARLRLSDAQVTPASPYPGQSATVKISLGNPGEAYPFYPGATLNSSTTGASIGVPEQGVALDAGQTRPLSWEVRLEASLPAGNRVELTARVLGEGRKDCPQSDTLQMSFTLAARPDADATSY